jgi:anaerobic selenocysteine-containing dehydrogenase
VRVFRELAVRMGFEDSCFQDTEDDMIRATLNSGHPFLQGITLERLDAEHSVRLNVADRDTPFLPFAEGGFGTASGKCEFGAESLGYIPPRESRLGDAGLTRKYPLEFITSKFDDAMNSTFGYRADVDESCSVLHLHCGDASPRGIQTGDRVRVFNGRGALLLKAHVADSPSAMVGPGVVRAPAVRWAKNAEDGRSANVLTSDILTDIGGGPVFYSCLVEVERCGD